MYFPIFRGRQYELLALRESAAQGILATSLDPLSMPIVPIVEPVNNDTKLDRTIDILIDNSNFIGIIFNPIFGNANNDTLLSLAYKHQTFILPFIYINENALDVYMELIGCGYSANNISIICTDESRVNQLEIFLNTIQNHLRYIIIGNTPILRNAVHSTYGQLISSSDPFYKRSKNADYLENECEFFSNDHRTYLNNGFVGYSDYSVVGNYFSDGGAPAKAVAIHIVYPAANSDFYINHFVSDSNNGTENVAGKFSEALRKLNNWGQNYNINTEAVNMFIEQFRAGRFRGLGKIKQFCIQNHLEVVYNYFHGL